MLTEQDPPAEFVAARAGRGGGERVLVRRGGPLRPRDVVLARRAGETSPELWRVARLTGDAVELLPADGLPTGGGPFPADGAWSARPASVIGTLLLRWQCDDQAG